MFWRKALRDPLWWRFMLLEIVFHHGNVRRASRCFITKQRALYAALATWEATDGAATRSL